MKTYNNLYNKLLDINYIKSIIYLAAKGKTKRKEVQKVLENIDEYANKILEMFQTKSFYMLPSHNKTIIEKGKERVLTISPFFPNRILDYLMTTILKPIIRKSMYEYSVGNVDGRGIMYGKKITEKNFRKYKYYIKLDIHHFYPSVTPELIMSKIENKIRDKDFIDFCRIVVYSCNELPIGSYYSQWISNWLLEELDHKIKEEWQTEAYIRYVDDMVLMSNNKRKLKRNMYYICKWLTSRKLCLKRLENVQISDNKALDFLGFKYYKNKTILRTRNFKGINKKIKKVKYHCSVSQARSLLSRIGWLKQTELGYLYYRNRIKKIIKLGKLKKIVSIYDKKGDTKIICY